MGKKGLKNDQNCEVQKPYRNFKLDIGFLLKLLLVY